MNSVADITAGHKFFFLFTQNIHRHNHKTGKRTLFWATSYLHTYYRNLCNPTDGVQKLLHLMTLSHEDKLFSMECKFTVKDKLEWTRLSYNFMYYEPFSPQILRKITSVKIVNICTDIQAPDLTKRIRERQPLHHLFVCNPTRTKWMFSWIYLRLVFSWRKKPQAFRLPKK